MIGEISRAPTFRRLLRYAGQKQEAKLLETNLPYEEPHELAAAMEAHSRLSRIQKPCYHISVSPAKDDRLEEPQWLFVIDRILELMQLQRLHQYVGFLHYDATFRDTGIVRPHLHLITNLVGYHGLAAPTFDDFGRLETAMRSIEKDLGLQPTDSPKTERLPTHRSLGYLGATVEEVLKAATSSEELFSRLREFDVEPHRQGRGWRVSWQRETQTGQQLGFPWSRVCDCLHRNRLMANSPDINPPASRSSRRHRPPKTSADILEEFGFDLERVGDRASQQLFLSGDLIAGATKVAKLASDVAAGALASRQESAGTRQKERGSALERKPALLVERTLQLAEAWGVDLPPRPRADDPTARTIAQIEWIEGALEQLDPEAKEHPRFRDRLGKLSTPKQQLGLVEETLVRFDSQLQEQEDKLGSQVAKSLLFFSKARLDYYRDRGYDPDTTAVSTQFGKIVPEVGSGIARIALTPQDDRAEEPVFRATYDREGKWQIETDRLSSRQKARVLALPTGPAQLQRYRDISDVVNGLFSREPEAFSRPGLSRRNLGDGLQLTVDTRGSDSDVLIRDRQGDTIFHTRIEEGFVFSDEATTSYHLGPEQFARLTADALEVSPEPEIEP